MIKLLQEILDAGKISKLPLDMEKWYCGTSCCLCGDVAIMRGGNDPYFDSYDFSRELDLASADVFNNIWVADAIYAANSRERTWSAKNSGIFTTEELKHPHLTTDHNDRAIAHDFVRLVMRKCNEKLEQNKKDSNENQ